MKITYCEYKEIETMIKRYYKNLDIINAKTKTIEKLKEILKNIDYNWHLDTDIQSVNNNKICVLGGNLPSSNIDSQIDYIFTEIEKNKNSIKKDILDINDLIRKLEKENLKTNELLSMLDEESQRLLYLRYKEGYSYEEIAEKELTCKSNIHLKIKNIIYDISRLMIYLNSIKVENENRTNLERK